MLLPNLAELVCHKEDRELISVGAQTGRSTSSVVERPGNYRKSSCQLLVATSMASTLSSEIYTANVSNHICVDLSEMAIDGYLATGRLSHSRCGGGPQASNQGRCRATRD